MIANILEPSLPQFASLPVQLSEDAVLGYAYGFIFQANPLVTMTIFVIRSASQCIFFHLANAILEGKELDSHKYFLATSAAVNLTFLIVMRELNLMGRLFSCMVGFSVVGHLIYRVRYIQNQEELIPDSP